MCRAHRKLCHPACPGLPWEQQPRDCKPLLEAATGSCADRGPQASRFRSLRLSF
jgi:hypothetical protein